MVSHFPPPVETAEMPENGVSLPEEKEDRPISRKLHFPEISTPVTASKATTSVPSGTRVVDPLPAIGSLAESSSSRLDESDIEKNSHRRKVLNTLQKAMAKPPYFEGNTGEKSELISTWWKQVGNYAKTYEDEDIQALVIKSFLRGPAALWLDSREREIGRELTVQELADGLTQEYGSETTSAAALQKLETLSMASPGCATLAGYNSEFNKLYNQCSQKDHSIAIRCYVKGLHPKYLKWMVMTEDIYNNLAEVKAAATRAVAKHEMMQLNYANFDLQKGRAAAAQKSKQFARPISGEGTTVNLNFVNESAGGNGVGEGENDTTPSAEGQVAAISSSHVASAGSGGQRSGFQLTDEQRKMLIRERRCFKCHKRNHRSSECRSTAATTAPVPLNQSAPSRK